MWLQPEEEERMSKFLKLEIEDLEERIAPSVPVLTTGILSPQGTNTVVGPAAAAGGAATAFANITGAGVDIANVDFAFVC